MRICSLLPPPTLNLESQASARPSFGHSLLSSSHSYFTILVAHLVNIVKYRPKLPNSDVFLHYEQNSIKFFSLRKALDFESQWGKSREIFEISDIFPGT